MITPNKIVLFTGSLILALCLLVRCTTSQQTVAVNTIGGLESTVHAAYDSYIICIAKGSCSTNGLTQVASAYDKFQGGVLVAVSLAQNSTNAFAPQALTDESTAVLNLISTFK